MRIARLLGLNQAPLFPRTPAAVLLVLVVATAGLAFWGSARAQSATFQQETKSSQGSSARSARPSQSASSTMKVPVQVRSLTIQSNDLPESDRLDIVRAYQGGRYPLEELMERIRLNLSDRGYAEARAQLLQPRVMPTGQPPQSVDVSVEISADAKFTLDRIEIEGNRAIPAEEIIQQFPLHPGDLFNATAILKGLDNLKKLYASKGYVDFGAMPRPQMDNARHTVTLILNIREGEATRP